MYKRVKSPHWHVTAIIAVLALAGLFFINTVDLGVAFIGIWTLRLIAVMVFCFSLGMSFKAIYVKRALFALTAVFAALACGEAYLAYRSMQNYTMQTNLAVRFPEFADEFRQHQALYDTTASDSDISDFGQDGAGYLVTDLAETKAVFDFLGFPYSEDAITFVQANVPDSALGYRPAAHAAEILAVRMTPITIIYAVTYNMLPSGWRVTPQNPGATEAVVFMGGSFTFGEGLNDADSFPYKAGQMLGSGYQVFNFGYSGYSTHQMLAMLENGYLDDIAAKYDRLHIFYLTTPSHRVIAAGRTAWGMDGPMYIANKNNAVEHIGSFRDNQELLKQKQGNALFGRLTEDNYQKNLQAALIKSSADILKSKYNADLTVVEVFSHEDFLDVLQAQGIPLLTILTQPKPEHIIPGDGRPSAAANTIFAEKIVDYIEKFD